MLKGLVKKVVIIYDTGVVQIRKSCTLKTYPPCPLPQTMCIEIWQPLILGLNTLERVGNIAINSIQGLLPPLL